MNFIVALEGDFTFHGVKLQNEVMRYDVKNVVSGKKYLINLDTDNFVSNNHMIQDVDLEAWRQRSILKNGQFIIPGMTTLKNVSIFEKELG